MELYYWLGWALVFIGLSFFSFGDLFFPLLLIIIGLEMHMWILQQK